MSIAPRSAEVEAARRHRWIIIGVVIAILVIAVAVIGTSIVVWLFFFGSEAPPAPALGDALRVLQSAAPSE